MAEAPGPALTSDLLKTMCSTTHNGKKKNEPTAIIAPIAAKRLRSLCTKPAANTNRTAAAGNELSKLAYALPSCADRHRPAGPHQADHPDRSSPAPALLLATLASLGEPVDLDAEVLDYYNATAV